MTRNTLCGLMGAALFFYGTGLAQAATVLDKVYSSAQAERGADLYQEHCAHCHEGDEPDAPAPKGEPFVERWREAPLDYVYTFIRTKMPGNAPGSLDPNVYLDILAYLLRENGYPAGNNDLKSDQLPGTMLVGLDGPKPLPPDSLVRVVGCLVPQPGGEWQLTKATPPARVNAADETSPEEIAVSAKAAPGMATYSLRNAEDQNADKLKGQKVQAKGTWSGSPDKPSVGIQSLASAGGDCGK